VKNCAKNLSFNDEFPALTGVTAAKGFDACQETVFSAVDYLTNKRLVRAFPCAIVRNRRLSQIY
jgi:hypothetical protein